MPIEKSKLDFSCNKEDSELITKSIISNAKLRGWKRSKKFEKLLYDELLYHCLKVNESDFVFHEEIIVFQNCKKILFLHCQNKKKYSVSNIVSFEKDTKSYIYSGISQEEYDSLLLDFFKSIHTVIKENNLNYLFKINDKDMSGIYDIPDGKIESVENLMTESIGEIFHITENAIHVDFPGFNQVIMILPTEVTPLIKEDGISEPIKLKDFIKMSCKYQMTKEKSVIFIREYSLIKRKKEKGA